MMPNDMSNLVRYAAASTAFVASFLMGAVSVFVFGGIAADFAYAWYVGADLVGPIPGSFSYLCIFAGVAALLAGVHSYRATLRRYPVKPGGTAP